MREGGEEIVWRGGDDGGRGGDSADGREGGR